MTTDSPPSLARLWHTRRHGEVEAGMLASIAAAPDLAGAACKGSTAWDWDVRETPESTAAKDARLDAAAEACDRCPALDACREWLHSLPEAKRPTGITAGELTVPLTDRSAYKRRRRAAVA